MKRKHTRRFPAEPLTLADVEALRAACSRRAPTGIRNRALLAVLFRSGLRVSEALALYPKDLDPVGGSLRVLHGKGNKFPSTPGVDPRCGKLVRRGGPAPRSSIVWCAKPGNKLDPTSRAHP